MIAGFPVGPPPTRHSQPRPNLTWCCTAAVTRYQGTPPSDRKEEDEEEAVEPCLFIGGRGTVRDEEEPVVEVVVVVLGMLVLVAEVSCVYGCICRCVCCGGVSPVPHRG